MRRMKISVIGALGVLVPAAALAGAMTGTINYRATATYSDGSSADRLYSVTVADLDGDGVSDEGWLRVACADGAVTAASFYSVKSPRDAASGMASGKRMHKPFTITKEWGAKSTAAGQKVSWDIKEAKGAKVAVKPTYNIKENKGARVADTGSSDASAGKGADKGAEAKTMAHDDWHQVAVRPGSPNLCAHGAEDQ